MKNPRRAYFFPPFGSPFHPPAGRIEERPYFPGTKGTVALKYIKSVFFFVNIILLASSAVARAAPGCTSDGLVCMEAITATGARGVDLWLESKRPGAITITLEQTAENLSPATDVPLEINLTGPKRQLVAELRALHADVSWKHSFRFHCMSGNKFAVPDMEYVYGIPFAPGQPVRVSQGFHGRFSHSDLGNMYAVDFDVPENTPVYAAREGIVIELEQAFTTGGPAEPLENANAVRIQHSDGTIGEYGHLRFNGAAVKVGQVIRKGDLVAYSGNTGRSTGPHLHFDVHVPMSGQISKSIPIQFYVGETVAKILEEGSRYQRPALELPTNNRMPASAVSVSSR
ncbi:MAG: M23 family metallopeptidase [Proteobacteria bacterium]|nr:MAG: M23 family metallopeptidase [Pseudomonadota bacterium]